MIFTPGHRPILITGASGFIGSHLARALTRGLVVGTCTSRRLRARLCDQPPNFVPAVADLRDPASLEALFAAHDFGTVFHLAARGVQAGDQNASEIASVNAIGSMTLAQIALRYKVDRFIYCGSGLEYESSGGPMDESAPLRSPNAYGASKAAGWLLLDYLRRVEGLPLTTVRPFTVFGPGESELKLIPYVIRKALRNEPVQLTPGTQVRDYTYISDVVDALLLAGMHEGGPGHIFNIGSGLSRARTVRSVVETTLDLVGASRSLCRFGEARRPRPEPAHLVSDSSLAMKELGWKARVSLEEGLARTILSVSSRDLVVAAA